MIMTKINDEENKQASNEVNMIPQVHEAERNPEISETEGEQDFDYNELQELLEDARFLEYDMEGKENPEKRRKIESDKGDGVLPVSTRSPRVVLNKIKLKEDVLERLRRIKKLAQGKVKESSLSTSAVPEKEAKETKVETDKSTDIDNKAVQDGTWYERKEKRKREDDDDDKKQQKPNIAKVARVNSEPVAKETQSVCEFVEKEDADIDAPEGNIFDKCGGDYDNKEKDKLVSSVEEFISKASKSNETSGDEVIKAAQNYAKSGAQTEPQREKLLTDEKLVVVVTEVLEEGNNRKQGDSACLSEQERAVDNNNRGEQEEALTDEDGTEDEEDGMTSAIYQLIKDVVKNRTEYFESALLRENEKLEERVLQLEKQNAVLHRFSYRLDYALKEITRKRQEARQSLISRGTQVNMNLHLSRTSTATATSKTTTIEIDVPEKSKDKTGSLQPKSNSTTLEGKNSSRSLTNTSKESHIHSDTIVNKTSEENPASAPKPDESRPTNTKPGENKSSLGSGDISVSQKEDELAKKASTTQQHEPQDASSYKKLQPGMGHFRLSPSYKRTSQQKSATEDTIETGHFRITPSGLEPQNIILTQRGGNSLANEPKLSPGSPRGQKMDTSITQSSLSQNQSNTNSATFAVSSSTITRSKSRPSSSSQTATPEKGSLSALAPSTPTKKVTANDLDRRSHTQSSATVPVRSPPSAKAIPQEKRNLSTPPSLINTRTPRFDDLKRKSPTSSGPIVSKALPSSSSQHRTFTTEPSGQRKLSNDRMENSHRKKESAVVEDPDIVIVSPTTTSSPKEQPKKAAHVRIHRVENQPMPHEGPQTSNRQRTEVMRTPQQHTQQSPQSVNHPSSSNQQVVCRSHDAARVGTATRNNIPPLRSNEPQQHVRHTVREDGTRLQMVQEQPKQVQIDKGQHDPRQTPRYVVQDARGQCQVVREQHLRPTDKAPAAVRYDPKQPPRYSIQEGPPQRMHERSPRPVVQEGPMQPVPHQQTLPTGAIVVQQHQGTVVNSPESQVIGPPIGIQDVRTQLPQPYHTQQPPQQHIIVKQHPQVQNPQHPQHPHQYQRTSYQYQQSQQRPTLPQQQNVPQTQGPVYYPPHTLQQVPPRANQPTGYQPRRAGLPREYVTSSRIPPERAPGKSNLPVGGPVHPRQQPSDVVYQPGALEGSTVRATAPMPPHGCDRYQQRQVYMQQGRQPQMNNQGIPTPMVEQQMPRPSSQGGARFVQTLEQQRIQERRTQGEIGTLPEKAQTSPAVGRRDSVPLQQPSPPSPPKPTASIAIVENGIVLSWNITTGESTESIDCYELFACQDDSSSTLPPILWKKIGVVKALPLPMACTLTQFSSGSRYQFAVRAVDTLERAGPFSDPCVITLKR